MNTEKTQNLSGYLSKFKIKKNKKDEKVNQHIMNKNGNDKKNNNKCKIPTKGQEINFNNIKNKIKKIPIQYNHTTCNINNSIISGKPKLSLKIINSHKYHDFNKENINRENINNGKTNNEDIKDENITEMTELTLNDSKIMELAHDLIKDEENLDKEEIHEILNIKNKKV